MGNPPEEVSLQLRFGAAKPRADLSDRGAILELPIPSLGWKRDEIIASMPSVRGSEVGPFVIFDTGAEFAGFGRAPFGERLTEETRRWYGELFRFLGERHLYRVWHYVPEINRERESLENYRRFNIGRAQAFEDAFGAGAEARMPAASAVGVPGGEFVMVFVGGVAKPTYVENPEQVPAYRYPEDYGPRAPSFARATAAGARAYVSGTASIKGFTTVGVGDIAAQLKTTASNLDLVTRALGLSGLAAVMDRPDYRLKVYLRNERDRDRVADFLQEDLGANPSNTVLLHTEICRQELDVEIEAAFSV